MTFNVRYSVELTLPAVSSRVVTPGWELASCGYSDPGSVTTKASVFPLPSGAVAVAVSCWIPPFFRLGLPWHVP